MESGVHALLMMQLGSLNELERLYGSSFSSSGCIKYRDEEDRDLNVPTFIRQRLAHHGYRLSAVSKWVCQGETEVFHYDRPDGYSLSISLTTPLIWVHSHNFKLTHPLGSSQNFSDDLLRHLDIIHGL